MNRRADDSLRERQRSFRESEILRVTCEMLREKPCQSLNMDVLSRRLGISKATLYAHFSSKDELIRTALERDADSLVERARRAANETSADRDRLVAACRSIAEQVLGTSDTPIDGRCCLAEVACPYDGWDAARALLDGLKPSGDPRLNGVVPLADALRALCAVVRLKALERDATMGPEHVQAILVYLFPELATEPSA